MYSWFTNSSAPLFSHTLSLSLSSFFTFPPFIFFLRWFRPSFLHFLALATPHQDNVSDITMPQSKGRIIVPRVRHLKGHTYFAMCQTFLNLGNMTMCQASWGRASSAHARCCDVSRHWMGMWGIHSEGCPMAITARQNMYICESARQERKQKGQIYK